MDGVWRSGVIIELYSVMIYYTTSENRGYLKVIVEPERRLRQTDKNVRAENDLLNDLGFNLCVAPRSLVVRLVTYFRVVEVVKTEVLSGQVEESERIR